MAALNKQRQTENMAKPKQNVKVDELKQIFVML